MDDQRRQQILEPLATTVDQALKAYIGHMSYSKLYFDALKRGPKRRFKEVRDTATAQSCRVRVRPEEEVAAHDADLAEYDRHLRNNEQNWTETYGPAIAAIDANIPAALSDLVAQPYQWVIELRHALERMNLFVFWAWEDESGSATKASRWELVQSATTQITPVKTYLDIMKRGSTESHSAISNNDSLDAIVEKFYNQHRDKLLILTVLPTELKEGVWTYSGQNDGFEPHDLLPAGPISHESGGGSAKLTDGSYLLFRFVGSIDCSQAKDAFIEVSTRLGMSMPQEFIERLGLAYQPEPMVTWWLYMLHQLEGNPNFVHVDPRWRAFHAPWGALAHCSRLLSQNNAPTSIPLHAKPIVHAQPRQYVTLDQIAAMVSKKKRTLELYKANKMKHAEPMPAPRIKGGNGLANQWIWQDIIEWLRKTFRQDLPDNYPELRS